jgi:Domain of unknown function (DUF4232)
MRTRVVSAGILVALVGAGVFYTAAASGRGRIANCSRVQVSGGNDNALTGGTYVAALRVRNVGKRDCTVSSRPWIRLGPLRHAVTVTDATAPFFPPGTGVPERVLTLRPGQHTVAQIFIAPGNCGLGRSVTFKLRARAGWDTRSVSITGIDCDNGTGVIWVEPFQR